jgi:NAD(P)-dependent dehydrogenase (short-subunit alcohol dehydrogenase family)
VDVTRTEALKAWIDREGQEFGPIRCLVNNAGRAGQQTLESPNDDIWDDLLAVNLSAPYYGSKFALPYFPKEGGGIVNIISVLGHKGVADQPAYCASKHGLVGLTKSLALALAPRNIRVNGVSPGWVDTRMAQQRFQELETTGEECLGQVPLKKFVEADQIAQMVYLLGSSKITGMTGQVVIMDGGFLS